MSQTTRVGFIGLGNMGSRMAANVRKAGYPLTVYNRTRARAEALAGPGVTVADGPREVAERSDVVITMLADPNAVRDVVEGDAGILAGAHAGLVYIDMSSIGPADAKAIVEKAAARGVRVINAPVFGSLGPAAKGELIVLAGGDRDLVDAHRPLLQTMGKTIRYIGSNEQACAVKLAVNSLLAGQMQLFGEAVVLATSWGLSRDQVLDLMGTSPVVSDVVRARMSTMYSPDAPAGFTIRQARKDLYLAVTAGYEKDSFAPLISAAMETFTVALRDHGDEDLGRIAAFIEEARA